MWTVNSVEDSLSRTIPSKKQPELVPTELQQRPAREEFKSPSEFSRLVV